MAKIKDYPEIFALKETDVLLISDGYNTKTITLRNLAYAVKSILKYPEDIKQGTRYTLV